MAGLPRNQPLPLNPFDQNNEGCLHSAYNCCLKMEYEHLHCNDIFVIHARCLGYLITELPPKGRKAVSEEILVCSNKEEELRKLSEYYINTLIRICEPPLHLTISSAVSPFQSRRIREPLHPSRPRMDSFLKYVKDPLSESRNLRREITAPQNIRYVYL